MSQAAEGATIKDGGGGWVGKSVPRFEDGRLLTGRGKYIDDLPFPNAAHCAIVRSPHAHARIRRIDYSEALKLPGVLAVLTGEDIREHTNPFSVVSNVEAPYYSLAVDKARYAGEPVAVIVADDRYIAEDAMELIDVDYEPLDVVLDPEEAAKDGAILLHEAAGTNVAVHRDLKYGDPDAAFAEADHVIGLRLMFPKYSSTPMETFGVVAEYEPTSGQMTIWSNLHGPFIMHPIVSMALNVPEHKLRFICPADVGGGFGIKTSIFPYLVLMAAVARKTGRQVKWIEDRSEHLLSSSSGTDRVAYMELAVSNDGIFQAMRARIYDNVGGYIRSPEPGCVFRSLANFLGPYAMKHLHLDAHVVMTNKSPTGPNRGYGCQHLYFNIERVVDEVASRLDIDPAELRRKNLLAADVFPYETPTGGVYDSGDYPGGLAEALRLADYEGLLEERKRAQAEGRLFGVGIALCVDPSVSNMGYVNVGYERETRKRASFAPKSGAAETASVRFDPLGKVIVTINSVPQGQGHETIVAQIVADELGLTPDDIHVVAEFDTDTRVWNISSGSYSSRFASVGTSAVAMAGREVRKKLLELAANQLEAAVDDLEIADGKVFVRGYPDRSLSVRRVAGSAHWDTEAMPEGMQPGLHSTYTYNMPNVKAVDDQDRINSSNTYGFVADVVAVEIDRDTGKIDIKKYVTVHDAGRILNPMIAEGQLYGAAMHGIAGAIYEELAYDESGQLVTGSFMDYLCPTAMEGPELIIGHVNVPSPLTTLGSKGMGESITESAPAAIANAVNNALEPLGKKITRLPLPPSYVWHLIHDKEEG